MIILLIRKNNYFLFCVEYLNIYVGKNIKIFKLYEKSLLEVIWQKKISEFKTYKQKKKILDFYETKIKNVIIKNMEVIKEKKELNFVHSGHLGDLIYSFSVIKEIANTHKCNFYALSQSPFRKCFFRWENSKFIASIIKQSELY